VTAAGVTTTFVATCRSCASQLPPSALACPNCGSLVHSAQLTALAAQAEQAERAADAARALGTWREALELLPAGSGQHAKVLAKVQSLSSKVTAGQQQAPTSAAPAPHKSGLAKSLAGLGAVGLLLLKFKALPLFLLGKGKLLLLGLTQAKTFFTMIIAAGVYTTVFGWWFALGLVVSIYIHEMGHVAQLSRYGIAASAPMFVPGLGAFVRLKQHPATVAEDARVGLAGPIWGAVAALLTLGAGSLFASPILSAIGHVAAWINLFNLLPVWQLDGGRAFAALSRQQRTIVAVALWLLALVGQDGMLFLLAIAATGRAIVRGSAPAQGDRPVLATYLILAIGLTAMVAGGGGKLPGQV
jgi:Zn-dependent protease